MGNLPPGTIVDRYRVVSAIGSGSMGDVLKGIDVDLNRPVAIKILSERHRENKELRARFQREGRAVAAISHPNVVQVFTTGQYDERPYIAMELLDGVDLGSVVARQGTMNSVQAARAALDAARGLEAAAQAGLIHRDVKPSNLVLLSSGVVKVTDFGLAKPLDPASEPALTAMGVVVGTPDYIAPEQARGENIDQRVDIYALGGTIYFLLTGSPPFRTGNPSEDKYLKVVARHLKAPAPDPSVKNPHADPQLSQLAVHMMAKKADKRPDFAQVIGELAAIVDRLQNEGGRSLGELSRAQSVPPEPTPFVGRGSGPRVDQVAAVAHRVEDDDSAATWVRVDNAPSGLQPAPMTLDDGPIRPPRSRWLMVVTAIAALTFIAGLVLYMSKPPAPAAAVQAPADAAVTIDAEPVVLADPVAPEGMVLVRRASGEPWLFVAKRAVSHGEYAKARPDEKTLHRWRKKNAETVVAVSFASALSFAEQQGGRLPSPEEWQAAAKAEGFEPAGDLWEWVDDGTEGVQARRPVVNAQGKTDRMRPRAHGQVTFRVARDL